MVLVILELFETVGAGDKVQQKVVVGDNDGVVQVGLSHSDSESNRQICIDQVSQVVRYLLN